MTDEEKDVLTEETLINEILSELKIELEVESEQDILLLQSKIKGAVREVKQKRNYAGRYTEEYVVNDLQNYFSNIKNLAMYDYGMIGGEFQKSNSDNGISVSMESRDSILRVLCRLHRSIRESSGTLGDSLESLLMSSRAVSMWRLGAIPIMGRDVYAKAVKEK